MITPAASPAAPAQYNAVPVQTMDIQAPQEDLSGVTDEAMADSDARQAASERVLDTPAGFAGSMGNLGGTAPSWSADMGY